MPDSRNSTKRRTCVRNLSNRFSSYNQSLPRSPSAELVDSIQFLQSIPSTVAKRGAQLIDAKLSESLKEPNAARRIQLLQVLGKQLQQLQNVDEVANLEAVRERQREIEAAESQAE